MTMDIYLLNDDFEIIKIIDDFSSLIWRRKYREVGDFELHCPHALFAALSGARYVYRPDRVDSDGQAREIGIIENIGVEAPTCFAKGRFLERLLYDRVICPPSPTDWAQALPPLSVRYLSDEENNIIWTHEGIARDLIGHLTELTLAAGNDPPISDGSPISTTVTGGNLMEYLYELFGLADASFSITCDISTGTLYFRAWKGADQHSTAIFSPEWDNLISFSYERSDKDFRNYAIVAGQGQGSQRVVVTIDQTTAGEERRELYVDARDLQQDDSETLSQYQSRLRQRGKEKLKKSAIVEKCEAVVDTESSLRYHVDFDLGDICTVKEDAHGISCVKRITEIEEVYESGSFTLSLVFGEGYLLLPDYLKRELK